MANLMGITNPAPAYESSNNNGRTPQQPVKTNDTTINNIVDPSKVVRSDARSEQKTADEMQNLALKYNSNFQSFLEQLTRSPDLAKELEKMITVMRNVVSTPGMEKGVTSELEQFLKFMQMDEKTFREFFVTQMKTGNRFQGPLFDMLRTMMNNSPSDTVSRNILNFVKKFTDYSSTPHIQNNLTRILSQMADYIPASWSEKLNEFAAQMKAGFETGDRAGTLNLMKSEMLPYLSNYVDRTNDMGPSRTLLSMFMLNMARYENGAENALTAAFRQLSGYSPSLAELSQFDDEALLKLFNSTNFAKAVEQDVHSARFAHIASQAMYGRYGTEMREVFNEITRAMLLNESVYMTLRHNVIPLDWNGNMMYSEMWVDPDANNKDGRGRRKRSDDETVRFLFKLDIQALGYVEITLAANKENVALDVMGPQSIAENSEIISEDIASILAEYGFNKQGVNVKKIKEPLAITKVFPDIFKGGSNVNVKI